MARQNPHSKSIIESATAESQPSQSSRRQVREKVMVVFNGPVHHYVTPNFYVETKPASGKVVPTWNYSAVQAYGTATIYFDSHVDETSDFLSRQLEDLTRHSEISIMGRCGGDNSSPWKVSDAPPRYVDLLKKSIIGVEIEIKSLAGKYKMSQELGEGDRAGVVQGFESLRTDAGREMAQTVKTRGELPKRS